MRSVPKDVPAIGGYIRLPLNPLLSISIRGKVVLAPTAGSPSRTQRLPEKSQAFPNRTLSRDFAESETFDSGAGTPLAAGRHRRYPFHIACAQECPK